MTYSCFERAYEDCLSTHQTYLPPETINKTFPIQRLGTIQPIHKR